MLCLLLHTPIGLVMAVTNMGPIVATCLKLYSYSVLFIQKITCVVNIRFPLPVLPETIVDTLISQWSQGAVVSDLLLTVGGQLDQGDNLVNADTLLGQPIDVGDVLLVAAWQEIMNMASWTASLCTWIVAMVNASQLLSVMMDLSGTRCKVAVHLNSRVTPLQAFICLLPFCTIKCLCSTWKGSCPMRPPSGSIM